MPTQDEKYAQLLRNIDVMTQMQFEAFEQGANCIPQVLFKDGVPNGFRREETFPPNKFQDAAKISELKQLLKSGYGDVRLIIQDHKVVKIIAGETIKPVP